MADTVRLSVNGIERVITATADTPLLYFLRDDLDLKGTRFGCGSGQCGACFVLIEGHATPACDTPLWAAAGKAVTTIEGLNQHPLYQAFLDEQAAQCGFCTSGIIVSAAALLGKNRKPTESEVRVALDRNLCRCGSHNRMVRAVLRAASK
jgi:nicotinate dehydrogenase subunit A